MHAKLLLSGENIRCNAKKKIILLIGMFSIFLSKAQNADLEMAAGDSNPTGNVIPFNL